MWTVAILLIIGTGTLLYFWHNIIHYFQNTVIPWVREKMGDSHANVLAKIISYADNGATFTRRQVKAGWQWLRHNLLGAESKYEQISPSTCKVTSKVYVTEGNGQTVGVHTVEHEQDWSELPSAVRERMIKNNESNVTINDQDILEDQYKKQAENQGVEIENAA